MTEAAPDLQEQLDKLKRKGRRDRRESHGRGLMQGILSMLHPGDLVIDCGANLGDIAGPLAETGAHVHAFEPDPYNFAKLTERLGHLPNVTLYQAAVGTEAGTVRLMRAANWDDNPDLASVKSTIVSGGRNITEAEGIDVALIDFPAFLQGLIARHGAITFLKMDIEGAELDLLEAMERQDLFAPIRLTIAETHERKFKDLRPRFEALRARIAETYPITKVNLDWI
jgi:FkbM family methyltransferase